MKAFFNILVIILIGFLSSSFFVELSPTNYKNTINIDDKIDTNYLRLKIDENALEVNPKNIVISHIAEKDKEITSLPADIFTASVYSDDILIKKNITGLTENAISMQNTKLIITPENPLKINIDISQETLGLEDGKYKIILTSNLIPEKDTKNIEIIAEYDGKYNYYEGAYELPNEHSTGITLFFADKNLNVSIPVTRFITVTGYLNSHVIEELQKGPVDTNSLIKTIDVVNSCFYNDNGTMHIDLPKDNTFYNAGSAIGILSYESLVNSIFAMNKYWQMNGICFYNDGFPTTTYFHGLEFPHLILPNTNPKAYVGFKINDRVYLYSHTLFGINQDSAPSDVAKLILEHYKTKVQAPTKCPIPKDLSINSALMEKDILSIDFNQSFLSSFADNISKKKFMVDALVYSFTSINGVNGVKFTVDGKPIENFIENKDMTGVLLPPPYINPEIVN